MLAKRFLAYTQPNNSRPAIDLANWSAVLLPTFEYNRGCCTQHACDGSGSSHGEGCRSDYIQDPSTPGFGDVDA